MIIIYQSVIMRLFNLKWLSYLIAYDYYGSIAVERY